MGPPCSGSFSIHQQPYAHVSPEEFTCSTAKPGISSNSPAFQPSTPLPHGSVATKHSYTVLHCSSAANPSGAIPNPIAATPTTPPFATTLAATFATAPNTFSALPTTSASHKGLASAIARAFTSTPTAAFAATFATSLATAFAILLPSMHP